MRARRQKVTTPSESSFVYLEKRSARFAFDRHYHPELELTLIQRSSGTRFVGDSTEPYEDGDLVLLGPDLPHTWDSEGSVRPSRVHRAVVIQFPAALLDGPIGRSPELRPVRELLGRAARGLAFSGETREEVARGLVAMGRLAGLERLARLLTLLDRLARASAGECRAIASVSYAQTAERPRATGARNEARVEHRIDRVVRFIAERATVPLSQPEVAARIGMTPAAFSRFFKRAVGKTFVDYLGELRTSHACRLLVETDRSVTQVALDAGFNNLSNFNRRFREVTGTTPRAYRRRSQRG